MPVGCDSIEPTYNFIRRPFTAISTMPRATTAVEISFMILLFWVTIRRSNQLNYAPALKFAVITAYSSGCPSIPKSSGKCRDRAASPRQHISFLLSQFLPTQRFLRDKCSTSLCAIPKGLKTILHEYICANKGSWSIQAVNSKPPINKRIGLSTPRTGVCRVKKGLWLRERI